MDFFCIIGALIFISVKYRIGGKLMANLKSAIKKTRTDEKKRMANKRIRSRMRTAIKKIRSLIIEGNLDEAKKSYPQVVSIIDKTVTKGIIHKNTASRYKSRISKAIKNAS